MKKGLSIVFVLLMVFLSACGAKTPIAKAKIPDNLRVDNVQLVADNGILFCSFYVNYYTDSAEFLVSLSDGGKTISKHPMIQKDGRCEVWFEEVQNLSIEKQLDMKLMVKESDEQKTEDIAKEICLVKSENSDEWEVSFLPKAEP